MLETSASFCRRSGQRMVVLITMIQVAAGRCLRDSGEKREAIDDNHS